MDPTAEPPRGGTALIVVPGVGDDAQAGTVASMSKALLVELGKGSRSTPFTQRIVVPALPGSSADAVVHDVACAQVTSPRLTDPLVIYEMHWADLSRFPGTTLIKFLLALYGLLFQTATIGIEAFRRVPKLTWSRRLIRVFSYLTSVLVVGLTAAAAILGVEFAAMLHLTDRGQRLAIAIVTLTLAIAVAWFGAQFQQGNGWRFDSVPYRLGRPLLAYELIALGVGVAPLVVYATGDDGDLAVAVHEVLWFGVRWILPVTWAAVGVVAIAISLTLLAVVRSKSGPTTARESYSAKRTAVLSVVVGGLGIAVLGAVLVATALVATIQAAGEKTKVPGEAAAGVGSSVRFEDYAAAVFERSVRPLGIALICTVALVALIVSAGFRYASAIAQARQKPRESRDGWILRHDLALVVLAIVSAVVAVVLFGRSSRIEDAIAVGLAVTGILLLVVYWSLRFIPSTARQPFRRGFDALLAYLGGLLHVLALTSALIVAAVALTMATPGTSGPGGDLQDFTTTLFTPLTKLVGGPDLSNGVGLTATVAVLAGLGALIQKNLAGVARGLDVTYDVATYMRVPHGRPDDRRPVEPPRRKVLRRYATLLRHIETVQAPDRIVIAAHSQGSMYTLALLFGDDSRDDADLIEGRGRWPLAPRLLPPDPAPGLAREELCEIKAPLCLLTAGCPILQTYAPNFPGQYDWPSDTAAVQAKLAAIGHGATWRNVYRSGDYFGRSLWAGGVVCEPSAPPSPLEEFCLGAGHHTGYWGDPDFAAHVRELIERPTQDPTRGVVSG